MSGTELARLRAALAERDAENARLRAERDDLAQYKRDHFGLTCSEGHHTRNVDVVGDPNDEHWRCAHCVLRALAAAPVAPGRRTLTDDEYRRAVELCERVVDAAHSDDGGPTVAGHYIGKLRDLLAGADWREQP